MKKDYWFILLILTLTFISGCVENSSNNHNLNISNVKTNDIGMGMTYTSGVITNDNYPKYICITVTWYDEENVRVSAANNCLGYVYANERISFNVMNYNPYDYSHNKPVGKLVRKIVVYESDELGTIK